MPFVHADLNDVQAVLDRLQGHYNLTSNTLLHGGTSSETNPRIPRGGFREEKSSYKPPTHLLHMIVRATNDHLPATKPPICDLRFHSREVNENHGSMKALKPDVVS
jgi:hypothetical protein